MQRLFLQENSPRLHFTAVTKNQNQIFQFAVNNLNSLCVISLTAVFLVAVVTAVVNPVTLPELWFALTIFTPEPGCVTLCRQEETRS